MRHCTTAGHAHMTAQSKELRRKICAHKRDSLTGFSSNSARDSEMSEFVEEMRQHGHDADRLAKAAHFLAEHRPVPEPTRFDEARIGHQVTLEYEDEDGETVRKNHVLGGDNEPDIFVDAACVNYEAPLGRALLGKRVGSELTIRVNRKKHDATVVAIGLPTLKSVPKLRQVA